MKIHSLRKIVLLNLALILLVGGFYGFLSDDFYYIIPTIILLLILFGFVFLLSWAFTFADKPRTRITEVLKNGQIVTFLAIIALLVLYYIPNGWHERKFGNYDYNRKYRELIEIGDSKFIPEKREKALESLEVLEKGDNSFRVRETKLVQKDTTINGKLDTIETVMFSYYKIKDKRKNLTAKFRVLPNNKVEVCYFDSLQERNPEYKPISEADIFDVYIKK